MALDKLVDSTQLDADLTSVANAIRTKGSTSAQLTFPSGFVSAIENIPGGSADENLDKLVANTLTSYEVKDSLVREFTFRGASALTTVTFSNAITSIGAYAFYNTGITALHFNCSSGIATNCFASCRSLITFVNAYSGATQKSIDTYALASCANLEKVDLGTGGRMSGNAFNGSSKMNYLVIRGTGAVATLSSTSVFTATPFASGGTGGTLYVPNDLIASYQAASNWSTILGYANNQIKSIESTHTDPNAPIDLTTHYADGTLIPT